jgi:hypothetical protein
VSCHGDFPGVVEHPQFGTMVPLCSTDREDIDIEQGYISRWQRHGSYPFSNILFASWL